MIAAAMCTSNVGESREREDGPSTRYGCRMQVQFQSTSDAAHPLLHCDNRAFVFLAELLRVIDEVENGFGSRAEDRLGEYPVENHRHSPECGARVWRTAACRLAAAGLLVTARSVLSRHQLLYKEHHR
jgi:hypothetical protein